MGVTNGVRQWVFQRIANVCIVAFVVILFATVFGGVSYESLAALMGATWFKVFALVVLVMGCLNSVLAGWQIVGDYARKFHLPENLLMTIVVLTTIGFFVAGILLIL